VRAARRDPATQTAASAMPSHVADKWRFFNGLIDQSLAADLSPWPLAVTAAAAIAKEWAI
jgi:hypothetical protein